MGSFLARVVGFAIALIMISTGFVVFALFQGHDGIEVEAAKSDKESEGYIWVDSLDPEPKIQFEWIDAANNPSSVYLDKAYNYYYYYGDHYQDYELPFEFQLYDKTYTECRVMACGYVDFGGFNYDGYYYFYNFPSTTYETGVVAAWAYAIGGYYAYDRHDFKIFALEGQTYGERWVCFEWNQALAPGSYGSQPNVDSYEITFEIILYESGLIKMQYLDADTAYAAYSNGGYAVCGIENEAGTKALAYNTYSETKLRSGLAVMFGKNVAEVRDITVDADTDDKGQVLYAQHRQYKVTAEVWHPIHSDMIRTIEFEFGNGLASAAIFIDEFGEMQTVINDPDDYFDFFPAMTKITPDVEDVKTQYVEVYFTPTFKYPFNTRQNINVMMTGQGIIPGSRLVEEVYRVQNDVEVMGILMAISDTIGFVENGGWMKSTEDFILTGFFPVYEGTNIKPPYEVVKLIATDETGKEWEQSDEKAEEGIYEIPITTASFYTTQRFNLSLGGIPKERDKTDFPSYMLKVDPFKPTPPLDIYIHAESYEDDTVSYDNDNEVFVTWETGQDLESGISGHYLSSYAPGTAPSGEPLFVRYPVSSKKILLPESGQNRVYIWAVDKAGNPSDASFATTKIDPAPVKFSQFSPGDGVWVNTRTPVCSVLIDDGEGSGVDAASVEYSISTMGPYSYGPWYRVAGIRDAQFLRASVQEELAKGKDNLIKFRAKDIAGNPEGGWTESLEYEIWVDEDPPAFVNFKPEVGEYQNSDDVVISVDVVDLISGREGSGVVPDSVQYRYSTSGKGLFGDWIDAPINSITDNVVHIEMVMDLAEGVENYVQFRARDNVGNYAMSGEFNILINSAPDVTTYISPPRESTGYTSEEKILFDSSKTTDPDGDDLSFTWYSDLEGLISTKPLFFRSLKPGLHSVTLLVNDPAHAVVEYYNILVLEKSQVDPTTIDTDGDGIYDDWERMYNLDPNTADSQVDLDHDTFTNLQEYQNGTDPTRGNSHPPYVGERLLVEENKDESDTEDQYSTLTLILGIIALIVVLLLAFLAYSKKRSFDMTREEEKELEKEELEYRDALKSRRERSPKNENRGGA